MRRRDISKALFATAAGSTVIAQRAQAQACTTPCYAQTAAEIAASVTPVNYAYVPGHVLRYGTNTTPGTTNMTAAIQAAINQSAQSGGSPAYAPAGTYLVNSTLVLPQYGSITGDGYASRISFTGTGAFLSATSPTEVGWSGSYVKKLNITSSSGTDCIVLNNIADVDIDENQINGFYNSQIHLTGTLGQGTGDIRITGNLLFNSNGNGIQLDDVNNVNAIAIHGNHIYGAAGYGIYDVVSGKGISILGNTIEGGRGAAQVYFNNASGVNFAGNYIESVAGTPAIICSDFQPCFAISITGNFIQGDVAATSAIILGNQAGGIAYATVIQGNEISGGYTNAIFANSASNCQIGPNYCTGSIVHLVTTLGQVFGVQEINTNGLVNHVGGTAAAVNEPVYSASITPNAALGKYQAIEVTNTSAFTINSATNIVQGSELVIEIYNASGGTMGAITWASNYKMAGAFTNPAANYLRVISFYYDGANFREVSRTAADMPA